MVMVFERKDGTQIPCSPRSKRRTSRRRVMIYQFVFAVAFITLGLWILVS
jgi:hypothetical protein